LGGTLKVIVKTAFYLEWVATQTGLSIKDDVAEFHDGIEKLSGLEKVMAPLIWDKSED
jgi:hypothetical protein